MSGQGVNGAEPTIPQVTDGVGKEAGVVIVKKTPCAAARC